MGVDEEASIVWEVVQENDTIPVTLKQIKSHLKEVFNMTEENMEFISQKTTQRQVS